MKSVALLAITMVSLAGCSRQADTPQPDKKQAAEPMGAQPAQSAQLAPAAAEGGSELLPSHSGTGHDANGSTLVATNITLTGDVLESINSSGFTYLRLKCSSGEKWAAVQEATVKVGSRVTVVGTMTAEDFEAKSINRKFDHIVFGKVEGQGGAVAASAPVAGSNPHAGMSMTPAVPAETGPIHVQKAEGADGRTVAEVWAMKDPLKDKHVAVRGKVVKFLPGIMGRNWIHLRDGTGSREKGDDDLTVTTSETTSETTSVGDVILVEGIARIGKDFGAGYSYPLMIEEATIRK